MMDRAAPAALLPKSATGVARSMWSRRPHKSTFLIFS
jgi:hypothetical protein